MDPYIAYTLAESRRAEFAREAATERLARLARKDTKRSRQAESRQSKQQRDVPRLITT